MTLTSARPTRRTLVRSAAWSVPVVSLAAAAPAFAASCWKRSTRVSTTTALNDTPGYTRLSESSGTWRTADPDGAATLYSGATITIGETKSSNNILFGFQNNSNQNLTTGTFSNVSGVTINQRPAVQGTSGSTRGAAVETVTTFTFDRTAYGLRFTIGDISNSGTVATSTQNGTVNFWDAVWLETSAGNVFTGANQAQILGTGTAADPFTPRRIYDNSDNSSAWNTALSVSDATGITWVKLHYYSMSLAELQQKFGGDQNNRSYVNRYADFRRGQGVVVSNMSMLLAPAGC